MHSTYAYFAYAFSAIDIPISRSDWAECDVINKHPSCTGNASSTYISTHWPKYQNRKWRIAWDFWVVGKTYCNIKKYHLCIVYNGTWDLRSLLKKYTMIFCLTVLENTDKEVLLSRSTVAYIIYKSIHSLAWIISR